MLNVLVAEDNMPISVQLSNSLNTKDIRCLEIINEGTKVYEKTKTLKPDFLILDLKMPGENGLQILEKLENDKTINTKVIVYSGEMQYMVNARNYSCVARFMSKLTPCEEIARELESLADELTHKSLENKVIDILFKLGFNYSIKGTRLINEIIVYALLNNNDNIKDIYEMISKRKGQNIHTIKSNVKCSINYMWKYGNQEKVRKILRLGEDERPSAKKVVTMVKYYVEK